MGSNSIVTTSNEIPTWIIEDIKDYHFQTEPWMCWITSIKNISLTMKKYYQSCPSPKIKNFNNAVGARRGIVPEPQTVTHLINKKIYNKVPIKLKEKTNSSLSEIKSLVERDDTSPVIFSVNSSKYFETIKRNIRLKDIGYDVEGIQDEESIDHVLIAFEVNEKITFFDPYTPYLDLPGTNTPEKAIFKLSSIVIDQLWYEAKTAPRWVMWLENVRPYQQNLKIEQKYKQV